MQKVMFPRALQTQPWCNSSDSLACCIDNGVLCLSNLLSVPWVPFMYILELITVLDCSYLYEIISLLLFFIDEESLPTQRRVFSAGLESMAQSKTEYWHRIQHQER